MHCRIFHKKRVSSQPHVICYDLLPQASLPKIHVPLSFYTLTGKLTDQKTRYSKIKKKKKAILNS